MRDQYSRHHRRLRVTCHPVEAILIEELARSVRGDKRKDKGGGWIRDGLCLRSGPRQILYCWKTGAFPRHLTSSSILHIIPLLCPQSRQDQDTFNPDWDVCCLGERVGAPSTLPKDHLRSPYTASKNGVSHTPRVRVSVPFWRQPELRDMCPPHRLPSPLPGSFSPLVFQRPCTKPIDDNTPYEFARTVHKKNSHDPAMATLPATDNLRQSMTIYGLVYVPNDEPLPLSL